MSGSVTVFIHELHNKKSIVVSGQSPPFSLSILPSSGFLGDRQWASLRKVLESQEGEQGVYTDTQAWGVKYQDEKDA